MSVSGLASGGITHPVTLICPVLHGDLIEGFHTRWADLNVPGEKDISKVRLQKTLKTFCLEDPSVTLEFSSRTGGT